MRDKNFTIWLGRHKSVAPFSSADEVPRVNIYLLCLLILADPKISFFGFFFFGGGGGRKRNAQKHKNGVLHKSDNLDF